VKNRHEDRPLYIEAEPSSLQETMKNRVDLQLLPEPLKMREGPVFLAEASTSLFPERIRSAFSEKPNPLDSNTQSGFIRTVLQ